MLGHHNMRNYILKGHSIWKVENHYKAILLPAIWGQNDAPNSFLSLDRTKENVLRKTLENPGVSFENPDFGYDSSCSNHLPVNP